ncbi:hypothetical protein JHS3_29650 [Jeongeupia sp. HS-3]|uniref:hypothetical protein n=1 Tax=Jeongeupia sp. HS-3 TaxID=1009682 RepID=UPI0018A451D1|nr:hypothetical protein [Jeongeupia sp. HS-3]BCL77229.1 hypothetical protein JHS3_29650 [Jeongeupia sp. HS-3]
MYDCLDTLPVNTARTSPPRTIGETSLRLKAPCPDAVVALCRAEVIASDLGYPTRRQGAELWIRAIDVHLALRLQALFPTLIACYEVPTRYRCHRR